MVGKRVNAGHGVGGGVDIVVGEGTEIKDQSKNKYLMSRDTLSLLMN